jgi:hypothetical protein
MPSSSQGLLVAAVCCLQIFGVSEVVGSHLGCPRSSEDAGTRQSNGTRAPAPQDILRILLPFDGATVASGSMLVILDQRWGNTTAESEEDMELSISIDGRQWLRSPSRRLATQLRLPSSLSLGRHRICVGTGEPTEQFFGKDVARLAVASWGEEACVRCDAQGMILPVCCVAHVSLVGGGCMRSHI